MNDGQPIEGGRARVFSDERGQLTLVDADAIGFVPVRTYVLHQMPVGARRGGHACRTQQRFLVTLAGRAAVVLDDGRRPQRQLTLTGGDTLRIGARVWHELEILRAETAILVFADGRYDRGDYVSDRAALPLAGDAPRPTR